MMSSARNSSMLRDQFTKDKFLFTTDAPCKLGTPEGGGCQSLYIAYRLVWVLWWTGVFVYDLYDELDHRLFPTYLTNWSYVSLTVSAYLQLACAVYASTWYDRHTVGGREMPRLYTANWAVYSLATNFTIGVSVLYWSVDYNGVLNDAFVNVATHGVNTIYALSDALLVTGVPVRILHAWLPLLAGIVWFLLALIYWSATGHLIYPALDFQHSPGTAVGLGVGALVLVIAVQGVLFLMYWARMLIYERCACCGYNRYTCDHSEHVPLEQRGIGEP